MLSFLNSPGSVGQPTHLLWHAIVFSNRESGENVNNLEHVVTNIQATKQPKIATTARFTDRKDVCKNGHVQNRSFRQG